LFLILSLE